MKTTTTILLMMISFLAFTLENPKFEIKRGKLYEEKLYGNIQIITETKQHFLEQRSEPIMIYELDKNKNIISFTANDSLGNLIEGRKIKYNSKNQKTEEIISTIQEITTENNADNSIDVIIQNPEIVKLVVSRKIKYIYNAKNKLIERIEYPTEREEVNGLENRIKIKYDTKGRLLSEEPYIKFVYDSKNRIVEEISYETDPETEKITKEWYQKIVTSYNEKNQIIKTGIIAKDNSTTSLQRFTYDKKGNVIEILNDYFGDAYNRDYFTKVELKYNDKNLITESKSYNIATPEIFKTTKHIYEFDTQGNWTSYSVYFNNQLAETTKRNITYYSTTSK